MTEFIRLVHESGAPQHFETRFKIDGKKRWFTNDLKRVPYRDGHRVIMISRDITDRKAAEAALRVSEERERHGRGIPADHLDRLFDPFFSTRLGTGIGLSVCMSIVQSMHGRLTAKNLPGRRTELTVSLPIEAAPRKIDESLPPPSSIQRRQDAERIRTSTKSPFREGLRSLPHRSGGPRDARRRSTRRR